MLAHDQKIAAEMLEPDPQPVDPIFGIAGLDRDKAAIEMPEVLLHLLAATGRDLDVEPQRIGGEPLTEPCLEALRAGQPRLADDGQHLEPNPTEQAALAEIRRLRGEGATMRGIATTLNHRTLRTRRGTAWRLESVARVLKRGVTVR